MSLIVGNISPLCISHLSFWLGSKPGAAKYLFYFVSFTKPFVVKLAWLSLGFVYSYGCPYKLQPIWVLVFIRNILLMVMHVW